MSKKAGKDLGAAVEPFNGGLPTYRAPWKGELLLACRKCRKKLRKNSDPAEAAKLKQILKQYGKQEGGKFQVRVLDVPCLKLCPKGGITVCTRQQLARAECSIVRTHVDVGALFNLAKVENGAYRS